ncbi:hypothetical protein T08_5326 [Trichinella sp. T8]|nr:hypothetical protein T08_5326 [Trichinella sp. T8]
MRVDGNLSVHQRTSRLRSDIFYLNKIYEGKQ